MKQLELLEALKQNTLEAIMAGGGPADIVVPSTYPTADKPWFVERTLQRWHEYYSGRRLRLL